MQDDCYESAKGEIRAVHVSDPSQNPGFGEL
jgi:hypothetical protein